MPNKNSAKKYVRVSAKKLKHNDEWRSKIANLKRKFRKAAAGAKKEEASALYSELQKNFDKAAKLNIMHKNNAARNKTRLAATLRKIA